MIQMASIPRNTIPWVHRQLHAPHVVITASNYYKLMKYFVNTRLLAFRRSYAILRS